MKSGSVIVGDLPDGHLMCGRRAADLAYRHLTEDAHQAVLPFGWQRLPDRTGQPIAHRVIQASAPRRTALEYRASAVRRFVSSYQRRLLWDIEENMLLWCERFRVVEVIMGGICISPEFRT
jgi:hypothetical protein